MTDRLFFCENPWKYRKYQFGGYPIARALLLIATKEGATSNNSKRKKKTERANKDRIN
jgi:hypothetical protein